MSRIEERRAVRLANKLSQHQTPVCSNIILPNTSGDHVRSIKRADPVEEFDLINKKYVHNPVGDVSISGQVTIEDTDYPVLDMIRVAPSNSIFQSTARFVTETTEASYTDGFGGGMVFGAKHSAGSTNNMASIGFTRDGADDSGRIEFNVYEAGTFQVGKICARADGSVGIGTRLGEARLHVKTEMDMHDDSQLQDAALAVCNHASDTGEEVGIAFIISSAVEATAVPGAMITHERTGSYSKGDLHFKTSNTTNACTTRMTLDKDGILDLKATTGALVVNRLTAAQIAALTPVNGMIVYDTTNNKFQFYENGAWVSGSGLV